MICSDSNVKEPMNIQGYLFFDLSVNDGIFDPIVMDRLNLKQSILEFLGFLFAEF